MLGAHGFANGPTVTLAYGKLWLQQAAEVLKDLLPVGMCFATLGYAAAIFVGVPLGKYFIRKKMTDIPIVGTTKELEEGLFSRDSNLPVGRQTTHRSNLDTLSFHVGLIFAIYFITYLWVGKLFGVGSQLFNMIFVCCILTTIVVKMLLQKTKFDYLVDDGLVTSLENSMLTCAALYNWAGRTLMEDKNLMERNAAVEATPPGSNGCIALPYFQGRGTPDWNAGPMADI